MDTFNKHFNSKSTIMFAWGRFNPPTIGHEKLIQTLSLQAESLDIQNVYIIPTASQNNKKDPLFLKEKIEILKYMVPDNVQIFDISKKNIKTWFDLMSYFYNSHIQQIYQIAGSDRIGEFQSLFEKYNGVPDRNGNILYNFPMDSYQLISSGERDPDSADAIEGMSASKLRALAVAGNYDMFKKGMSPKVPGDIAKHTFEVIRQRIKV